MSLPLSFHKSRYVSIPLHVLAYMAWRNLVSKKLRSFLTILGVIIGIGAIYFLLSLGLGLQNLVTEEIIGNQSVKSIDVSSPNSAVLKLDSDAADRIEKLTHVNKLGRSFSYAGSLRLNNSEVDTIVYGVDGNYQELANLAVVKGRLLEDKDANAIFLNQSALKAIGIEDTGSIIGQQLNLVIPLRSVDEDGEAQAINESYTVVGVIDSGAGSELFIPGSVFEQAGITQYSQVKLVADNADSIPDLRKQIESMGFETTSPIDTLDQIGQIFKYFNVILVGFGAIGMIVAVLGMFNTLTISLLERTREIGLMVALGGRHKDMRKLFVLEAVLLSAIGSMVGIAMAMLGGEVVNVVMNGLAESRGVRDSFDIFATPWWLTIGLVIFMVVVGLIVVFFPARRAEHINPIEALRRE